MPSFPPSQTCGRTASSCGKSGRAAQRRTADSGWWIADGSGMMLPASLPPVLFSTHRLAPNSLADLLGLGYPQQLGKCREGHRWVSHDAVGGALGCQWGSVIKLGGGASDAFTPLTTDGGCCPCCGSPPATPADVSQIMLDSWAAFPDDRPSFDIIEQQLHGKEQFNDPV